MARDPKIPTKPDADPVTCPDCGHTNIPGAAFCARCGRSLGADASASGTFALDTDSQATTAFEPVTSSVTPLPSSPWARPGGFDLDPGQTSALPIQPSPYPPIERSTPIVTRSSNGVRGFWLGALAVILITALLAVYLYSAWISDSARTTIDGWLPWM